VTFEPNEDQAVFLSGLDRMMQGEHTAWAPCPDHARFDWSSRLDAALEANGFLDAAREPSLGLVTAAAMVYELSRLPVTVEAAASSMLRPLFAPDLPRPLAVITGDAPGAVRFLPQARAVLAVRGDGVYAATLRDGDAAPVDSLFAYPMGALAEGEPDWQPVHADPQAVLDVWRAAIAAEIAGSLQGGLDAVVAHVKERHQFRRPIGSFQAVQHRLATCAAMVEGARWLALRAAQRLDTADAALAAGYAQGVATQVVYDLHQFMGAMGLTLEHPLHRWTYRVRLLRSELGGAEQHFCTAAERLWASA
jgi:hypothetical protein